MMRTFFITTIHLLALSYTKRESGSRPQNDWLINGAKYIAAVTESADRKELTISNGLIEWIFRITPGFATTAINNLMTGESLFRAVCPEGNVTISGKEYNLCGLRVQQIQNYLTKNWIGKMTAGTEACIYVRYTVNVIKPRFHWKIRKEWISGDVHLPLRGIYLSLPERYFINGSSKVGMGSRIVNRSLPRQQQEIIERQNIFDGTWTKTLSMGWMMVPLTEKANVSGIDGKSKKLNIDRDYNIHLSAEIPARGFAWYI
jgi:hypothetical protein